MAKCHQNCFVFPVLSKENVEHQRKIDEENQFPVWKRNTLKIWSWPHVHSGTHTKPSQENCPWHWCTSSSWHGIPGWGCHLCWPRATCCSTSGSELRFMSICENKKATETLTPSKNCACDREFSLWVAVLRTCGSWFVYRDWPSGTVMRRMYPTVTRKAEYRVSNTQLSSMMSVAPTVVKALRNPTRAEATKPRQIPVSVPMVFHRMVFNQPLKMANLTLANLHQLTVDTHHGHHWRRKNKRGGGKIKTPKSYRRYLPHMSCPKQSHCLQSEVVQFLQSPRKAVQRLTPQRTVPTPVNQFLVHHRKEVFAL